MLIWTWSRSVNRGMAFLAASRFKFADRYSWVDCWPLAFESGATPSVIWEIARRRCDSSVISASSGDSGRDIVYLVRFQIISVLKVLSTRINIKHPSLDWCSWPHSKSAWAHASHSLMLNLAVRLLGGCSHLRVTRLDRLKLLPLPRKIFVHFSRTINRLLVQHLLPFLDFSHLLGRRAMNNFHVLNLKLVNLVGF